MNKLFAAIFSGLTAVAGYTTYTNVGMPDSGFASPVIPASVRAGSAGRSVGRSSSLGGSRRGK